MIIKLPRFLGHQEQGRPSVLCLLRSFAIKAPERHKLLRLCDIIFIIYYSPSPGQEHIPSDDNEAARVQGVTRDCRGEGYFSGYCVL